MDKKEHTAGLIKIYESSKADAQPNGFMSNLFENALHKLNNGVAPNKVEQWVTDMEKLWRKTL